jgi:hypothetical protein
MCNTRNMTTPQHCECPTERLYSVSDICDYCRQVAFHDDPDYAEMMGFTLRNGEWVLKG